MKKPREEKFNLIPQSKFLKHLREYGNLVLAAEHVGISMSTVYRHKREDGCFRTACEESLEAYASTNS